uniref:Serine/threonine-protein kinase BSK1-like TPR repeats domain-containing protein n=1 Tax=Aegilops tauschii subsp. strangulata TaxID=200361 RepID=A0A453JG56_AEGTS
RARGEDGDPTYTAALPVRAPPRQRERDRWSPEARFIEAAHNGDVGKIKKIAKELDVQGRGIPVTVANTTYMGMNALHAAAGCGSFSVFQYLVEEVKMDVDLPDTAQQFTPVAHAVTNGNLPAVKYLIDHGADVHQQRAKGNITLLHAAAVHGYSEIVKFLLARGADVNAVSDLGTALTHAAIRGFPSIVKTLLEHNADGGAKVSGDSPRDNLLVKAAEKGLTEAIKCLLEAGANPNVPNTFGRLPIELAAEYGTREDVEILFPFTSPISTVANWSVDGIISHVKMEIKQLEDDNFVKERVSDLKRQADEAFKKQDYLNASVLYTQALKMDNFDAKLLSNRSLCWLRMGDGQRAFDDATKCKRLRPKWAKAHYRQGSALMFMKVH